MVSCLSLSLKTVRECDIRCRRKKNFEIRQGCALSQHSVLTVGKSWHARMFLRLAPCSFLSFYKKKGFSVFFFHPNGVLLQRSSG